MTKNPDESKYTSEFYDALVFPQYDDQIRYNVAEENINREDISKWYCFCLPSAMQNALFYLFFDTITYFFVHKVPEVRLKEEIRRTPAASEQRMNAALANLRFFYSLNVLNLVVSLLWVVFHFKMPEFDFIFKSVMLCAYVSHLYFVARSSISADVLSSSATKYTGLLLSLQENLVSREENNKWVCAGLQARKFESKLRCAFTFGLTATIIHSALLFVTLLRDTGNIIFSFICVGCFYFCPQFCFFFSVSTSGVLYDANIYNAVNDFPKLPWRKRYSCFSVSEDPQSTEDNGEEKDDK